MQSRPEMLQLAHVGKFGVGKVVFDLVLKKQVEMVATGIEGGNRLPLGCGIRREFRFRFCGSRWWVSGLLCQSVAGQSGKVTPFVFVISSLTLGSAGGRIAP